MNSTEASRLELLAALAQLSRLRPEWRLGQTVANLAMTAGRMDPGGVWELEDDEALTAAKTLIAQYDEFAPVAAEPIASPDGSGPANPARQDGIAGRPSR